METAVLNEVITPVQCQSNLSHIRDALYVLNGKWKLPLIFALIDKSMRFNEIQDALVGITPKILSKELKDLEMNGFVIRQVYPTTPVTVIYKSTAYSATLKNVLNELKLWGKQHREKIKQNMRSVKADELSIKTAL
jgi:DNA-binding HxlR family transcriptional regulator